MAKEKPDWSYFEHEVGRYVCEDDVREDFIPYLHDHGKLVWYVFVGTTPFNLFSFHYRFLLDLLKANATCEDDFINFAESVRRSLQHNFWRKAEYESTIGCWPIYVDLKTLDSMNEERKEHLDRYGSEPRVVQVPAKEAYKVDIYTQIMLNWDRFIEYLWDNRSLITPKKLGIRR